jgi:hypothetical protein
MPAVDEAALGSTREARQAAGDRRRRQAIVGVEKDHVVRGQLSETRVPRCREATIVLTDQPHGVKRSDDGFRIV